jgi:DNA replication protein DnaC
MTDTKKTIENLEFLKLQGMVEAYESILSMPSHQIPSVHELLSRLVEAEIQNRTERRTKMYLKQSNIRYNAVLDTVKCSAQRNISQEQLFALADCSFIRRSENVIITGSTGSGKSYLACAIGRQACIMGYKTLYLGMNRFVENLALSRVDGTYIKLLNQLEKYPLIIIDDFGLAPLEYHVKLTILQLLEDRYGKRTTIITSQLPIGKWYQYLNEPTIADAIMDRLSVSHHKFELKGESLRRKLI